MGNKNGVCGYGIMQVTDGMNQGGNSFPVGSISPTRVAGEPLYNIAAGTKVLINKWNVLPNSIGASDPQIVEHWYYPVWAYNSFSQKNALKNPGVAWTCGLTAQDPDAWSYPERVWGCLNHPPSYNNMPLWNAQNIPLPPASVASWPPPVHANSWTGKEHRSCALIRLPVRR